MAEIILKKRRERSVLGRHPWLFSGAIDQVRGEAAPGESVEVLSVEGEWLARAAYSPRSQIRARIWTFDRDERVDAEFFRRRIAGALQLRKRLIPVGAERAGARPAPTAGDSPTVGEGLARTTNGSPTVGEGLAPSQNTWAGDPKAAAERGALRLVNAESDGLPGLIVDRYADTLVLQALTAGVEYWKQTIADLLLELTALRDILERSPAEARELEGLGEAGGALRGQPPARATIAENGLDFAVNLERGHKTGLYLDQRENRRLVRELGADREVLDCFCYTGGFALNAAAGGARSVLALDSSAEALRLGQQNARQNGLADERLGWMEADVFRALRTFRDQRRSFDLIVLDPPKFAPTAARAGKAARGYKDINLLAFKLLRPDGVLVTFSCSGGVDAELFQKIVFSAALDAGTDARIVRRLGQPPDHPVALSFPEGRYLKGLVCVKTP